MPNPNLRTDLTLRPIIFAHLGEQTLEQFMSGFGNNNLAINFFDVFNRGSDKIFPPIRNAYDVREMKEFAYFLYKLDLKYYNLRSSTREVLSAVLPTTFGNSDGTHISTGDKDSCSSDYYDDFGFHFEENEVDNPEKDAIPRFVIDKGEPVVSLIESAQEVTTFQDAIDFLRNHTAQAIYNVEDFYIRKKVDFRVCATAEYARIVWQNRIGVEAPTSVHADAPGPFGNFLQDILAELFNIFEPAGTSPPSARSAMRALQNITNSGAEFDWNW